MLLYHSLYICDIVLVISFVTFRHLINDMAVLDATPFVLGSCYICDIVLVISFVTFRHLINDMAVLDATPFVLGSCYICDIVLVISFVTFRHLINDLYRQILVAYKLGYRPFGTKSEKDHRAFLIFVSVN